jgi:hypothetical protein
MFKKLLMFFSLTSAFICLSFCDSKEVLKAKFKEKMCTEIKRICQEYQEKGEYPSFSCQLAIAFFENIEKKYEETKKDPNSDEYFLYYCMKGVLSAPNFEDYVRSSYLKAIELRDSTFQLITKLTEKYKGSELAIKVKEEISEISSKTEETDWVDALLLSYGKCSLFDILEKELIEEIFIENSHKFEMIDDFFLEEGEGDFYTQNAYEKIFVESFYTSLFNLFNQSNNNKLAHIFGKYSTIKNFDDFIAIHFKLKSIDHLLYKIFPCTEFESKLHSIYSDYLDKLTEQLSAFNLFE